MSTIESKEKGTTLLLMYPHLLLFHLFNIFLYIVFKFAFFEFRNKLKSGSNWSTQILGANMHYLFTFHS